MVYCARRSTDACAQADAVKMLEELCMAYFADLEMEIAVGVGAAVALLVAAWRQTRLFFLGYHDMKRNIF